MQNNLAALANTAISELGTAQPQLVLVLYPFYKNQSHHFTLLYKLNVESVGRFDCKCTILSRNQLLWQEM